MALPSFSIVFILQEKTGETSSQRKQKQVIKKMSRACHDTRAERNTNSSPTNEWVMGDLAHFSFFICSFVQYFVGS